MTSIDLAEVRAWARAGGDIARSYFRAMPDRQRKKDNSFVTRADLEIEHLLRRNIQARYPDHGIMGEEQGIGAIDREFVWSLDPLDGTDAFVGELPVWAISIGLLRHGQPYLGVVYLPMTDECYWNVPGGMAYCDDDPIVASPATTITAQDAIFIPSKTHRDYTITFPGKARSFGSFAAHCCYVARGSVLGALLGYPQLWDIAAGVAILHTAGGVIATIDGTPLDTRCMLDGSPPPEPLLISTAALLDELCTTIHKKDRV